MWFSPVPDTGDVDTSEKTQMKVCMQLIAATVKSRHDMTIHLLADVWANIWANICVLDAMMFGR